MLGCFSFVSYTIPQSSCLVPNANVYDYVLYSQGSIFNAYFHFLILLQDLGLNYSHVRKTRGDGNCFYRAFGFAYLEELIGNQQEYDRYSKSRQTYLIRFNFSLIKLLFLINWFSLYMVICYVIGAQSHGCLVTAAQ